MIKGFSQKLIFNALPPVRLPGLKQVSDEKQVQDLLERRNHGDDVAL